MSDAVEFEEEVRHRRRYFRKIERAVLAGMTTAILGGLLWACVMGLLHRRLGFLALGIGFAVGSAVRHFGRGRTEIFGVIAMFSSVAGCLIGDIAGGLVLLSEAQHLDLGYVLRHMTLETVRITV